MGGAQSAPTRKLSIPNEDSQFIKVSEAVAERLRRCTEESPADKLKKNEPPPECPPTVFQEAVRDKENIPYHPGDELLNFYYGPSVTSLRVLQAKEKELKESEDYWTKRIQNMEKQHAKLSYIMENAYSEAVKEVSCQAPRPPANVPFPCEEFKDKVISCYKKNPDEILLCAGEVTDFADCVHETRINNIKQNAALCDDEKKKKRVWKV